MVRSEGIDMAKELDYKAAAAWVGHPYFDVIDNSTDFETKICRMIAVSALSVSTRYLVQSRIFATMVILD